MSGAGAVVAAGHPPRRACELFTEDVCQSIVSYIGSIGDLLRAASVCRMFCIEVYSLPIWVACCRLRWGNDLPAVHTLLAQHQQGVADEVDTSLKLKDICLAGCPRSAFVTRLLGDAHEGRGLFNAHGHTWRLHAAFPEAAEGASIALRLLDASRGSVGVSYSCLARARLVWQGRRSQRSVRRERRKLRGDDPDADVSGVATEETLITKGPRVALQVSTADPEAHVTCRGLDCKRIKKRLAGGLCGTLRVEVRVGVVSASYSQGRGMPSNPHAGRRLGGSSDADADMADDGEDGLCHSLFELGGVCPEVPLAPEDVPEGMDTDDGDDSSESSSEESDDDDDDGDSDDGSDDMDVDEDVVARVARLSKVFFDDPLAAESVRVLDYSEHPRQQRSKDFPGRGKALAGSGGAPPAVQATPPPAASPSPALGQAAPTVHDPVHIRVHVYKLSTLESDTSLFLFSQPVTMQLFLSDTVGLLLSTMLQRGGQPMEGAFFVRLGWKASSFAVKHPVQRLPNDMSLSSVFGYSSGPHGLCLVDPAASEQVRAPLLSPIPAHACLVHVKFFDRLTGSCTYLGSWYAALKEACSASVLAPAMERLRALRPDCAEVPEGHCPSLLGAHQGPPRQLDLRFTGQENSLQACTALYLQYAREPGRGMQKVAGEVTVLDTWVSGQVCDVSIEPSPQLVEALREGHTAVSPEVRDELLSNLTALSRKVSLYRGASSNVAAVVDFEAASRELLRALSIRSLPLRFSCRKGENRVTVCTVPRDRHVGHGGSERTHIGSVAKPFQPLGRDSAFCVHVMELLRTEGRCLSETVGQATCIRVWYEFDVSVVRLEARPEDLIARRAGLLHTAEQQASERPQPQPQDLRSIRTQQRTEAEMSAEARRALYAERFGSSQTAKRTLHNEEVRQRADSELEEHRKQQMDKRKQEVMEQKNEKKREREEVGTRSLGADLMAKERLRAEIEAGKEEDRRSRMERERNAAQREKRERELELQRVRQEMAEQREAQNERLRMQATSSTAAAARQAAPTPGSITVQFQLPGGLRQVSTFDSAQTLADLKTWLVGATESMAEQSFTFRSTFPRHEYTDAEMGSTLQDLRFSARTQLVVHVAKE